MLLCYFLHSFLQEMDGSQHTGTNLWFQVYYIAADKPYIPVSLKTNTASPCKEAVGTFDMPQMMLIYGQGIPNPGLSLYSTELFWIVFFLFTIVFLDHIQDQGGGFSDLYRNGTRVNMVVKTRCGGGTFLHSAILAA